MIKKLFIKYKDVISYLFFGVCTTIVNIVAYWVCAHLLHLSTIISTSIAWALAIAFAYITNRLWVFHSKAKGRKAIFREVCSFIACRLLTGFLDVAIMYIFVDKLHCPDLIVKVISNIIVIIANYIASKLVIFNEKDKTALYKKVLVALALLVIGFSIAQLSDYGVLRHGDGSVDNNVYKYVGQVIRDGGMPYRDTFDHKGPLLYIAYALSGYINEYRGSWLLEFAAIFASIVAFYIFARRLKCRRTTALLSVFAIMTVLATFYSGGCCCLYSIPFIAVSLCIFLNYLNKKPISNIAVWLCGLCCGSVLMIRPNLCAAWVLFGIVIAVESIKAKKYKELGRFILFFIVGLLTIIAPIMVWLISNGAFAEFCSQYLEFNFSYSTNAGGLIGKSIGMLYVMEPLITGFAFLYMIYRLVAYRTKMDVYFAIFYAVSIMAAGFSGREYGHYLYAAVPALIYPYATLFSKLPEVSLKDKRTNISNSAIVVTAIALLTIVAYQPWRMVARTNVDIYVKRNKSAYANSEEMLSIASTIKQHTNPEDRIVVFGLKNVIYELSGRRSLTRYSFMTDNVSAYKNVHDEYYGQLEREKPKIVVMEFSEQIPFDDMFNFLKKNNYEAIYPSETYKSVDEISPAGPDKYIVFYRPADGK